MFLKYLTIYRTTCTTEQLLSLVYFELVLITITFHYLFISLNCISVYYFQIAQYLNKDWSCNHEIPADPPEFSVWSFQNYGGPENSRTVMDLGMHCTNDSGSLKLSLYCPFWMINKTGLMLSYRVSLHLLQL